MHDASSAASVKPKFHQICPGFPRTFHQHVLPKGSHQNLPPKFFTETFFPPQPVTGTFHKNQRGNCTKTSRKQQNFPELAPEPAPEPPEPALRSHHNLPALSPLRNPHLSPHRNPHLNPHRSRTSPEPAQPASPEPTGFLPNQPGTRKPIFFVGHPG